MKIRIALLLGLAAWATPASANWYKAESDHFVVYADDSERDVQRFAEMLESYHKAMELATGSAVPKPSPSGRVTVYAVGSAKDIQKLSGDGSKFLQGFYIPRASGSIAFVQDMHSTGSRPDEAMTTLLHEYSHHFLMSSQSYAMPRWFNEGAAEFYSTVEFARDGGIQLGRPNVKRAPELYYADKVSIEELLDDALYAKRDSKHYDAFYGRAWLLYHYLIFSPERTGQLKTYLRALVDGTAPLEAARNAFGDLNALDKDLDKYLKSRKMSVLSIAPERVQPGQISVTSLTKAHAEMLPVIIRSRRGVDEEEAKEVLADARAIAARYPGDADVEQALAEAEYDAGNDAEAIAAADRAIAIDPNAKNAYVQKGYALFREASNAKDPTSAFEAAMVPFSRLNAIENDHPLPLIYYYHSFRDRGLQPNETARHAIERAWQLAPFDLSLAFEVGMMLAKEGKPALAIQAFQPVASDPHGGSGAGVARSFIAQLEGQPEGTPINLVPPLAAELETAPEL